MSDSSLSAGSSMMGASPFDAPPRDYKLSSDLARLSLPAEYVDSYRRLAWVNSICFLFLTIGVVGLKEPRVIIKPLSKPVEVVQITLPPPDSQPKPVVTPKEDEPPPEEAPIDAPQVAPVVVADPVTLPSFPIFVEGPTIVTKHVPAASPPPPQQQAPPRATPFDASGSEGFFPDPSYPAFALRNRYKGTVVLEFTVDTSGKVTSVKVQKTSGFPILDEAAVKVVQERWRFPPGPLRHHYKDFIFELK